MPSVSVLVAAYHVEDYLERCIESLVGQTFDDLEVIVVDDASTDGTAEVAAAFEARDPRVRLIRHGENRGAGGARNTALDAATGEWIAFVDGDDWMVDHALERIHARCVSAGTPVGLFPALHYLEDEDRIEVYANTALRVPERFRTDPGTLAVMPVTPWSKLYRRDFLVDSGVRFPERINNEDVQFFYCLFAKTEPEVVTLDDPIYVYRRRAGSMMGTQVRVRKDGPRLLSNVWDFYVQEGLAGRYGGVLAGIIGMHLTSNLPKLDFDAQEPFYEGMRAIVRKMHASPVDVPLPDPLPDVVEMDYLGFLQRCQRELSRLRDDPWYRFGRLPTGGKVKRAARLALERAGLDTVVRAIQKARGVAGE